MIEVDPGDESAHCKLASFLIDMGKLDDGLQCLRDALEANPNLQETDLFKVSDRFAAHYNRLLYYSPGDMVKGSTVNPELDTKAIQEAFFDSDSGLSLIDGAPRTFDVL